MKRLLKIASAVMVTTLVVYFLVLRSPQIRRDVAVRDSIAYWSAGRLLIDHENPYDHAAVLNLERQQGYRDERPLVLRTPPWSLFLVAPIGWLSPFWAWATWIGLSLACLVAGVRACTRMYGSKIPPNLFTIVAYTFAPIPACLVSGQMGLVLMLGILIFLWAAEERPLLAGAALLVPFAKPHLFSAFFLVLALWLVFKRQVSIALGFMAALAAASGFALLLDAHIFQHYRDMLQTAAINREFIPALSGVVRLVFFRRMFWVQFVPMIAGCLWAMWFFSKNRQSWDWRQHAPALLVMSVLIAPYEWLSDESILLPAILQAAAFAYTSRGSLRVRSKIAIVVFTILNMLLLLILKSKVPFSTGIYFWSSLVWFSWYFIARGWQRRYEAVRENVNV
jgi:hypothetical protein